MASPLDTDIWYLIISILRAEYELPKKARSDSAKSALIALRLTSRFLATAAAPALLSIVSILKYDSTSYDRLKLLLSSPTSCQVVRTYQLKPSIIRSRQGDLSSAYHKIPPYLDYGRNSASPVIRNENKKLQLAAAHWQEQNDIIYPIESRVASSLAKTFKWSGSRGDSKLKDSIYFTALRAFVNLTTLRVTYPPNRPSKLFQDVANDYSIALGHYLASNPANLIEFRIRSLAPQDLPTLVTTMTGELRKDTELSLRLTTLDLAFGNSVALSDQPFNASQFSSSLVSLLQRTPRLARLRLNYTKEADDLSLPNLLLSSFTPPPLPALKDIALTRLAISAKDLLSLINFSPLNLNGLFLDSMALTESTWAQVFRSFTESETLLTVPEAHVIGTMSYCTPLDGSFQGWLTDADHKAFKQWKISVNQVVPENRGLGFVKIRV